MPADGQLARPYRLRSEGRIDPLGIDATRPLLSWELAPGSAPARGWHVRAASTAHLLAAGIADLWDSGRLPADAPAAEYAGKELPSRAECFWTVAALHADGRASAWASPARFAVGLLAPSDWRAAWIGAPHLCPLLRRRFTVPVSPGRATLYASALGCIEPHLNGRRVTDDVLLPGYTDTSRRIPYRTYDVSGLVDAGANTLGAILADGWYAGHQALTGRRPGRRPAALLQLEIEIDGGTPVVVVTDASWRAHPGPIMAADLLMGEEHDAQHEPAGWSLPSADRDDWAAVEVRTPPAAPLTAHPGPPVRRTQEIPAAASWTAGSCRVFDLGQNVAGRVRIAVPPGAGTVTLRHGEILDGSGRPYTANLRKARATDRYVPQDAAEWEPRFTAHGFRYVEVSTTGPPTPADAVTGVVLGTDLPHAAAFSCSEPLLDRLWRNVLWTLRGNCLEVPTDCPQRDERLGWTGDAQLMAPTLALSFDARAFLHKWIDDLLDAQEPDGAIPDVAPRHEGVGRGRSGWGDAIVGMPWILWRTYGDLRAYRRTATAIARWLDYCRKHSRRGRRDDTYGDWLAIGAETPKSAVATACFARSLGQAAAMAEAASDEDACGRWREMRAEAIDAFWREHGSDRGTLTRPTQASAAMALAWELVPPGAAAAIAEQLAEAVAAAGCRLTTGFVGTSVILQALADHGHVDLAYRLLVSRELPSWGYAIERGATTVWERWDGIRPDGVPADPRMNSFNHPPFASVGAFLLTHVGGIAPASPGFAEARIHPRPGGGLTFARASIHTVRGPVSCAWEVDEGRVRAEVVIPPGITGHVTLDTTDPASLGDGIPTPPVVATSPTSVTLRLGPGRHVLSATRPDGKMGR